MSKPVQAPRRLQGAHFAFMRALVQGLDERASWERYLRIEGEHDDLRTVRRTIAWIRDEFAAAARRERRPGTARLILLDSQRVSAAPVMPSLEAFAAEHGMEDFSEADLLEAYQDAYPTTGGTGRGGATRRARLIERQLDALHWLQGLVAQDPRAGDWVGAWLNPNLVQRLESAGITTIQALVERVNTGGKRWWADLRGVGERKAARLVDWLRSNEEVLSVQIRPSTATPPRRLSREECSALPVSASGLRPLEKLVVPEHCNGAQGGLRADPSVCRLAARTDQEAVLAWLQTVGTPGASGALSTTYRSYRREAERLLLWAAFERGVALSSLGAEDAAAFAAFLRAPPVSWCGPRHQPRWSEQWRPLEGALSLTSVRQSLVILRGLFAFLLEHGYLVANPFQNLPPLASSAHKQTKKRALTPEQWRTLWGAIRVRGSGVAARRLCRAVQWLYATGLRPSELVAARCEDLVGPESGKRAATGGWTLQVKSRAGHTREVPVPADLLQELGQELARHGRERDPSAPSNLGIHLLAQFPGPGGQPRPWTVSGLQQAIKRHVGAVADQLGPETGEPIRQATARWLRHSHASHALEPATGAPAGKQREAIEAVRIRLGHARRSTTRKFLPAESQPLPHPSFTPLQA
jgi:integrase